MAMIEYNRYDILRATEMHRMNCSEMIFLVAEIVHLVEL